MSDATPHTPTRPKLARILMVTGKGGVGKTTIAAGLAEAGARRGQSVFVEFGDGDSGRRVLGSGSRVKHVVIKPESAIEEMAAELFGSALLAKVVIGNFAMRRLFRAAPALRELGQLEAVRRMAAKHPSARVVVDMPATGHGLAWLRVPNQMRRLIASGPLHELSARLTRDLIAPDKVSVVIVTLPERLVLEETIELSDSIQREVGLSASRLLINRVPAAMPEHALAEAMRLSQVGGKVGTAAASLVELIAARDQARGEALDALHRAAKALSIEPVVLPLAPVDPEAPEVADWLEKADAA